MLEQILDRNVLLLMPALSAYFDEINKMIELQELRCNLNYIVSDVQDILRSSIISEFNSLNIFQKINGLKEIMLQVMDNSDIDSLTGARLCLTQYNDDDFYNETALDVSFFQEKNISHLVELHIVSDSQSLNKDDFIWSKSDRKDKHGNLIFDSAVK